MEFEEFARAQLPGLVRFAAALTGDRELAKDLVQDALVRAHLRWSRMAGVDRPDLYLRQMVINGHLSWRRRWYARTVRPVAEVTAVPEVVPDHAGRIAEVDQVKHLLDKLNPRQRAAIVLRFFEDRDDADIAKVLGCAQATVRSHVARGLSVLRLEQQRELAEVPEP